MKTSGTTLDQLSIEISERWASDQEVLDTRYINDADLIPPHSEIAGTSTIFSSQWAQLFDFYQSLPKE